MFNCVLNASFLSLHSLTLHFSCCKPFRVMLIDAIYTTVSFLMCDYYFLIYKTDKKPLCFISHSVGPIEQKLYSAVSSRFRYLYAFSRDTMTWNNLQRKQGDDLHYLPIERMAKTTSILNGLSLHLIYDEPTQISDSIFKLRITTGRSNNSIFILRCRWLPFDALHLGISTKIINRCLQRFRVLFLVS